VLAQIYVPAAGTAVSLGGNCTGVTLLKDVKVGCDAGQGKGLAQVNLLGNDIVLGK
jgi:hypothetical protein